MDEELAELYKLRELLSKRIDRLEKRERLPALANGNQTVVETKLVRPYIQVWVDEGKPITALADKANVNVETLYRVMRGEQATIREVTADKILQALLLPHIYNQIIPEPPESKYWED